MTYNLSTSRDLWFAFNDYMFKTDDPKFAKLRKFAKAIVSVTDAKDRDRLETYFVSEVGTALEYYL